MKKVHAKTKRVAALVTEYRFHSHADVILGKIMEGYRYDGGIGPNLELAGMYVEQFPRGDLSREMGRKHHVPIFKTIEEAVTLGRKSISVDGVLIIGEHGNYKNNEKGQKLYPRRKWFGEVVRVFAKHDKVVPVFNDKHLAVTWQDAKWMVDKSREMHFPLMAGSSLPLSYRSPEFDPPLGCEFGEVLGIGYSGLDIYGIHALEVFQAIVERRKGAERGVKWVQCLQGKAMWDALDAGRWSRELLEAGLSAIPHSGDATGAFRDRKELQHDQVALFLFGYHDGLQGAIAMLAGVARANAFVTRMKGNDKLIATQIEERPRPHPHFTYLLKAIELLVHSYHSPYPVERTLLTTGLHDMLLTSRHRGGRKLPTPFLSVRYEPIDYPHAPEPKLF